MKFVVAIMVIGMIAGCSSESVPLSVAPSPLPPPAPTTPTTRSALLWVMVLREDGSCIEGATIQVVRADGADEPIFQETPCNMWDFGGGLTLRDLTQDVEVRLRGAATSFVSREVTFLPVAGAYSAVFITLSKGQ